MCIVSFAVICNNLQSNYYTDYPHNTRPIIWNNVTGNLLGNVSGAVRLVLIPLTLGTRDLLFPKQFITWNKKTSIRMAWNNGYKGRQSTLQSVSQCVTLCTLGPCCNDSVCSKQRYTALTARTDSLTAISLNATSEVFSVFVLETKHKFYLNLAQARNIHVHRHASLLPHTHWNIGHGWRWIWKWINIHINENTKIQYNFFLLL